MRDMIRRILTEYTKAKQERFAGHLLGSFFRNDIPKIIYNTGIVDAKKYLITGSVGQGNWATVPWVCIFNRAITTSATKGVYIVYLLSKDGKTLYLTFNQGCTDIRNTHSKKETIDIMRKKAQDIIAAIDSRGFRSDEDINLGDNLTELAYLYQKGTIFYKAYTIDNIFSEDELRADLEKMICIYNDYILLGKNQANNNLDLIRFKKLLEVFVHQLKVNNNVLPGDKVFGQGYKDMPKIQSIYAEFREYNNFILDITLQPGYNAYNSSNYIHLRNTWINIVPSFKQLENGNHDIYALQLVVKPDNKPTSDYPVIDVDSLGLFDNQDPNGKIKMLFDDFVKEILHYQDKTGRFDSWEIIDEVTALKHCDKSFFDHNGSGVPKGICWFFDAENLNSGESKQIKLIYNGQEYIAKITNDTTDRRRIQILWQSKLGKQFASYRSDDTTATFRKTDEDTYEVIIKGGEKEMTTKEKIAAIKNYIAAKGFNYEGNLIENFYLSLKSKPFVILAGISGTGKTRLVKLFAEAIGAEMKLVPVRPDWSDSSDLFGHTDLNNNFHPGAILEFIKKAEWNKDKPFFLCLDEMNLARVEYYLSDFLSIIETRDRKDNGDIETDALIDVDYYKNKEAQGKYGRVFIPENLYIVGTVNMDETTFPFSKKVLDRANTIEFSFVNLMAKPTEIFADKPHPLNESNSFLRTEYLYLGDCNDVKLIDSICFDLEELNSILAKANLHVGYRVRDEISFYMMNNKNADLLDTNAAFDNEIMQKILPRIQGSSRAIKDVLSEMFIKCAGDYTGLAGATDFEQMQTYIDSAKDCKYPNSSKKIAFMMRRYEEDGFTSYWL